MHPEFQKRRFQVAVGRAKQADQTLLDEITTLERMLGEQLSEDSAAWQEVKPLFHAMRMSILQSDPFDPRARQVRRRVAEMAAQVYARYQEHDGCREVQQASR